MQVHLLCVEVADHSEQYDAEGDERDLVAGAHQRREEHAVGGGPENVAVHLLPAVLVTKVTLLVTQKGEIQLESRNLLNPR